MRIATIPLLLAALAAGSAHAGNTSSNSSSNSSNGVHSRIDTIITDDERGRRRVFERRMHRDERGYRERRRHRHW